MTHGDHALVPRRTRRPGAHPAGAENSRHPLARRSSFALAAALTSVALSATAAVSLTGTDDRAAGSATTAAAAEPTVQPLVADAAIRSASAKADAVLTDAAYVTREGNLSARERKRVQAAAQNLRTMLDQAHAGTDATVEVRETAAASRSSARTSLAERATGSSVTRAALTTEREPAAAAADATAPTNLTGAATQVALLREQGGTGLPILDTPLTDPVDAAGATAAAPGTDAEHTTPPAASAAPSAERIENVTSSLRRLIVRTDGDAVVSVKAGPTPEEIAAAKRAAEERRAARAARAAEREAVQARAAAAARAAEAKEMAEIAKRYGNGQIPSSVLCELSWTPSEQLRCDAAAALEDLNGAFRAAFGRNLDLTDGYRSYPQQVAVAAAKGYLAAVPGTSNHGLGQAVDLSGGIESFGSAEHGWMLAHAGAYGWKLPSWAQAGGSKPEAWHWEYGTSY